MADKGTAKKIEEFFKRTQATGGTDLLMNKQVHGRLGQPEIPEDKFRELLSKQVRSCCMGRPFMPKIVELIDLMPVCQTKQLLPVLQNEVMPMDPYAFGKYMTKVQNQLWTTVVYPTGQQPGPDDPVVVPSKTTMEDLRKQMAHAKVLDKHDKSDAEKAAFRDELQGLRIQLVDHVDGQDPELDAIDEKWDELDDEVNNANPYRGAAAAKRIDGKKACQQILNFIDSQEMEDQREKMDVVTKKYDQMYSQTERAFRTLKTAENFAMMPQIPPGAIAANYNFEDWVEDKSSPAPTIYVIKRPPPSDQIASQFTAKAEAYSTIEQMDDKIKEVKDIGNDEIDREDKRREAAHKRRVKADEDAARQLKQMAEMNKARLNAASARMSARAQEAAKMADQLNSQANAGIDAAAKAAAQMKSLKPIWIPSIDPPPADGIFKVYNKMILRADVRNTQEVKGSTSEHKGRLSAGFNVGSAGAQAQIEAGHRSEHADGKTDIDQGQSKEFLSFEVVKTTIDNDLWTAINDCLQLPNSWYIPMRDPYYFWDQNGLDARFYVKEVYFMQKLAYYTSSQKVRAEIEASFDKSETFVGGSVGASYGGASGKVGGEFSKANEKQKTKSSMKANMNKNTIYRGNVASLFLLLAPITPAPYIGYRDTNARLHSGTLSGIIGGDAEY